MEYVNIISTYFIVAMEYLIVFFLKKVLLLYLPLKVTSSLKIYPIILIKI